MAQDLSLSLTLNIQPFKSNLANAKNIVDEFISQFKSSSIDVDADITGVEGSVQDVQEKVEDIPDANISITADGTNAENEAKDVEQQVEQIPDKKDIEIDTSGNALSNLAQLSLVYQGLVNVIGQVKGAINDLIGASNIQEDAEVSLRAALRNTGLEVDNNFAKLKNYAAGLQEVTRYGDETILMGTALAQNVGKFSAEELPRVQKAAIGLAEAYRMDLQTAFQLIGRASAGQTQTLTRYGIVIDTTKSKEEQFQQVLETGIGNFSIAKERAESGAGALEQYSNIVGDLKEKIGDTIKEALLPFIKVLKNVVTYLNEHPKLIKAIIVAIGTFAAVLVSLKIKQIAYNTALAITNALTGNWVALAAAAAAGVGFYATQTALLRGEQEGYNEALEVSNELLSEYKKQIEQFSKDELGTEYMRLKHEQLRLQQLYNTAATEADKKRRKEQLEQNKLEMQLVRDLYNKRKEGLDESIEDIEDYYDKVTFADNTYYQYRKQQILDEIDEMQISSEKKRRLREKLLEDLDNALKKYIGYTEYEPLPLEIEPPDLTEFEDEMNDEILNLKPTPIPADQLLPPKKTIQEWLNESKKAIKEWSRDVVSTVRQVTGVWSAYYDLQSTELNNEYEERKEAIENSAKSEEDKKKELEKLDEEFAEKQKELAEEQKPMKIAQATSNVALGITRAFADPGGILGFFMSGLIAAQGALQIATIKAEKYADGIVGIEGPGTDRSDSILAFLSRGESIINAEATRKNRSALSYINEGGVLPGFAEGEVEIGSPPSLHYGVTGPTSLHYGVTSVEELKLLKEQNKLLKENLTYLKHLKGIKDDTGSMRKSGRRF